MFQVRIHGRGGQGVVTAAELLSVAAFLEGKHAQAFPSFGSERTGSPVVSFCRIDDKEIRLREPILEPDGLIVQDPTLFKAIDVFQGLRPDGYLLVNTNKGFDELHVADVVAKTPKRPCPRVTGDRARLEAYRSPVAQRGAARCFRRVDRRRTSPFRNYRHPAGVLRQAQRSQCRCSDRRL
jgi:pyruvate ferredoxin oxidoreductase gamma subunit